MHQKKKFNIISFKEEPKKKKNKTKSYSFRSLEGKKKSHFPFYETNMNFLNTGQNFTPERFILCKKGTGVGGAESPEFW